MRRPIILIIQKYMVHERKKNVEIINNNQFKKKEKLK